MVKHTETILWSMFSTFCTVFFKKSFFLFLNFPSKLNYQQLGKKIISNSKRIIVLKACVKFKMSIVKLEFIYSKIARSYRFNICFVFFSGGGFQVFYFCFVFINIFFQIGIAIRGSYNTFRFTISRT